MFSFKCWTYILCVWVNPQFKWVFYEVRIMIWIFLKLKSNYLSCPAFSGVGYRIVHEAHQGLGGRNLLINIFWFSRIRTFGCFLTPIKLIYINYLEASLCTVVKPSKASSLWTSLERRRIFSDLVTEGWRKTGGEFLPLDFFVTPMVVAPLLRSSGLLQAGRQDPQDEAWKHW